MDQKAYWPRCRTSVVGTVPVIGGTLLTIVRGGGTGNLTLSRFFAVHTYILPWSLALFAVSMSFCLSGGSGRRLDGFRENAAAFRAAFPNQIFKDTSLFS